MQMFTMFQRLQGQPTQYSISKLVMNFIEELINSQSPYCTHTQGCILSALRQTLKNLKYGLLISAVLQLIRSLKALTKSPAKLKASFRPAYLSIAIFLAATVLILRLVRCILRRIRQKQDGWNSLLAGAAAGWAASKTLSRQYWYFYLTFIGSRLIGAAHKYLMAKGVLSEENSHWHSYVMMTIAHGVHSYGYFLHPYILKDDMYGLYLKMSALTPNEKKWHLSSLRYNQRRLVDRFGASPVYDAITANRMRSLENSIARDCKHC